MRRIAIRDEWWRGQDALKAAKLCLDAGLCADAVSRAYYAVMHAAKAALLTRDVVAESHGAVRRLFGQALVQPGEIEPEWARILAAEQDLRITADYGSSVTIDQEAAARVVRDAARFAERMAAYLAASGVSLEEPHEGA